ncbi:unnamed protein product [Effrenium voratum]|nr:unnamed protein product [Effrenium voratum]
MVSSHFAECGKLGVARPGSAARETTFAEFLEWLFAENKEAPASEAKPAKAPSPPPVAPKAKAVAVPRPETMPAEAAERWKQFQELLKTRQYLEDGSTSHPLCYYVQLCKQAFAEAKYEDTTILLERISNSIVEDEKRIAAAFDHFDKDGSGVLERQEFRFMCAYLGWSSEESNSIDVNQDGTVSLPELQTYVGHLGGVQKFFEHRRQRVSASRKDVRDICPIVGVEVGARVRSHFYYKNGQKSKSWREAQVVPPSWILSSSDETSMAAALREVGILDDSQAMWRMVFPMSELRSIQALVSCQRSALAQIRQQASASHENALPELRDKFASLGYGDYEMDAVFSWVKDLAPLVVHVHLDQMGQFLESDEFYRNQFETKTSCGALDDGNETRIGWERTLFGDAYEGSKPFDRCKYGALNVTNDFRGSNWPEFQFLALEYNDDELNEICRVAMAALPNSDGSKPVGGLPKSAWPQVLRGESEDPAREWITVGYPTLAHRGQGRFAYEVELYGDLCCPQVGLLSEHFAVSLGKRCPTGVGDDEHGWALDGLHGETWAGGQSSCWQGARLAESNGGKQIVGVAVDLAEGKMWFGVNGQWSQEAAVLPKLPERIAVYPALTFKGRGAFVFQQLSFPPPIALGFTHWPKTHKGKFRVDCPRVGDSDTLCCYKEFQVHGELCLKKHVQRLVASVKYREAPKFERSRNVEMTKAGHLNGTYAKVGSHNNAPLYRSEGGWIFYDRAAGLWKVSESSAEDAGPKVGDTVTAERGGGPPQAGVVSKLAGSSVEICWADGSEEDKMQPKDEVTVAASAATQFKDNGTFLLQATQDAFIQDRAPPVSGWMATPESGGYLEPDAFKDAMATLGLDESSSKSLADQLLSAISSGKQVVLRRPSVDLSFDGLWDKLGREEDAASAWKKATQAAVSKYLDSKGISKDCQVIQTEHPYPATSHSWTKDLKIPGTKGMKFVFSKMCVTYDSCASFYIRSGGISKPSVGPGMRVEVEGKDGLRRFGSVVEVAEEKGGRLVRLDYMGTAVFNKYDQVEVQKCAGDDDSWVRGKVVHFRGRGLYDVQYKESGDEDTYPEDQIRLVAATTPNCPDCASEMLWADHQTGGYAYGWSCNECGEGQLQTELGWFRWCCKECCNDYCSRCWPEKRPEGEEAPPVKKDSKKNMPASDEFAFVVDNFERLKVTYNLKEELPGSEIETFTVDYDQPLAPAP